MTAVKTTVSHSEIEAMLVCERKHYYQYGLRLTSKGTSEALSQGLFGHSALETMYKFLIDNPEQYEDARQVMKNHIASESVKDFTHLAYSNKVMQVIDKFVDSNEFRRLTPLAAELKLEAPLAEGIDISLVIDLISEDEYGKVEVTDHKFVGREYRPDQLPLMPQLPKYVASLRALNLPVDFTSYNVFIPKSTTYSYMPVPINETLVEQSIREHIQVASRIIEKKQAVIDDPENGLYEWSQNSPRVFSTFICDRCPMKRLCAAELISEEEANFVLDSNYQVRKTQKEKEEEHGQEEA